MSLPYIRVDIREKGSFPFGSVSNIRYTEEEARKVAEEIAEIIKRHSGDYRISAVSICDDIECKAYKHGCICHMEKEDD